MTVNQAEWWILLLACLLGLFAPGKSTSIKRKPPVSVVPSPLAQQQVLVALPLLSVKIDKDACHNAAFTSREAYDRSRVRHSRACHIEL